MTDTLRIHQKRAERAVPVHEENEFDHFADNYNEALQQGLKVTGESGEYYVRGRVSWTQRRLRALGQNPRRVLDFGCGTGGNTASLRQIDGAVEVVGTDISAQSLDEARLSHRDSPDIHFAAIDQLPADESFDLAFCNGVFHHIPPSQRATALGQIRDRLRRGGLFALWENNPWNPGTRYVMSRIPFDRDAITLTPPQMRALVRDAGFEVLTTNYLFFFPRILRWFRPTEPLFSRIPLGGQYLTLCRKPSNDSAPL